MSEGLLALSNKVRNLIYIPLDSNGEDLDAHSGLIGTIMLNSLIYEVLNCFISLRFEEELR